MRSILLTFIFLFSTGLVFAQDDASYATKAAELQKEVWGTNVPEFKSTTVPAELSKESAIVLARSFSLQRTSSGRIKFMILATSATTHTVKIKTYHERVKINDKVALEAFSTIEYQKKLDKTVNLFIARFTKTNNTYIGAKIIKPDGKEIIVNTSEEVLLKNDTKDKQGKLAISGLEVGDILDYYICTNDVDETMAGDSFAENDNLFTLVDEYPVLYYSIDFQFNKKTQVRYISANGAPALKQSTDDAGDQLYSIELRNIPKYQNQLWTSTLRQYPYIEIGSSFTSPYASSYNSYSNNANDEKSQDPNLSRLDNLKIVFEKSFVEAEGFTDLEKKTREYFKSSKNYKTTPIDSACKILYDEWRFNAFCYYQGDELGDIDAVNYRTARSAFATMYIAMQLTDMNIDYDVLMVASRNSNSLENVFLKDDFSFMIRINKPKVLYMAFDDITTQFNEIPERFQGEKVVVLTPTRHNAHKYTFTESPDVLPVIPASQNMVEGQLQVSLMPDNMQKLKVERLVSETGALKHAEQKYLLPVQVIDNGLQALVNGDDLNKRLGENYKAKKMKADYAAAFQKQAQDINTRFTEEIKGEFDQEPEHVENCKIIDPALENTDPAFQYSASFVLNNLVKKAGDNYIVDAGKLTGTFYKLEDNDRKRDVDIYMPCARTFKYSINIAIPQGYNVKGAEEMDINKTNKTGSFISSAKVSGNMLAISITRTYNDNFEKTADWPLVVEMLDAASSFNNKKILFEKK
jgi:hypothetical protein